jgi:hypothetical protein
MRDTTAAVPRWNRAARTGAAAAALCALGALLGGCRAHGGRTAQVKVVPPDPATASADTASAVVQVREYPRSPTVMILGWSAEAAAYGIRTQVRRDGSFDGEHTLYVSAVDIAPVVAGGGSRLVRTIVPAGRQLEAGRIVRDPDYCLTPGRCTPYEYLGVRVPDALLRASRDSLSVRLVQYGHGGADLVATLPRVVVASYLATVDSVTAALRAR